MLNNVRMMLNPLLLTRALTDPNNVSQTLAPSHLGAQPPLNNSLPSRPARLRLSSKLSDCFHDLRIQPRLLLSFFNNKLKPKPKQLDSKLRPPASNTLNAWLKKNAATRTFSLNKRLNLLINVHSLKSLKNGVQLQPAWLRHAAKKLK